MLSHPSVNIAIEAGTDGTRHGVALPETLVHGVVTKRFVVDLVGRGEVCAVKFRPGGFTALTGVRVAPNVVCPADRLLDPSWTSIRTLILAEASEADRVAMLDAHLAPLAREPEPPYLQLLEILGEMMHDSALTRVVTVGQNAGLSQRSLQRLFNQYLGVSPKWALRRYRLHDAMAAIDANQVEFAELAAKLGWFDQAHFSRDFRSLVGKTPSEYARRAHPS